MAQVKNISDKKNLAEFDIEEKFEDKTPAHTKPSEPSRSAQAKPDASSKTKEQIAGGEKKR